MKTLSDIRSGFLEFFHERGSTIVPSSSLVPHNDPTLLFTNAGMVQFKNVFIGAEKRPYTRATSVQKCVRAGGKHNDLDNVGYTARHHTFFEMLGNFSFGDYFKEGVIPYAWEFSTKVLGLSKDKIWVTVNPADEEARNIWKKVSGLPDSRIISHPDNTWQMGPVGPCGYCSELFYDQGDSVAGGPPGSPEEDGDRYLEFWNLVFMQFEQIDANTRRNLPKPSIDTGLGLERMAAILQGVTNNYETDLFRDLIHVSEEETGAKAQGHALFSHRIIADHLRSSAFLIADGVLPSNEGRGYVLRRIMRRAMRHAHLLGAKEPLMYRLVPELSNLMGTAYPELIRAQPLIMETLKLEESRFRETLARGLKLLDDATAGMGRGDHLAGDVAFKLYDTYGFPLDLTQDALKARQITVDVGGFDAAMAKQRADARKAWAGSGDTATEKTWFSLVDEFGKTEFLGYDSSVADGAVLALINDKGEKVKTVQAGETVRMLTNQTPFYGEMGGQVGDTGMLSSSHAKGEVLNTEKKLGLHVHTIKLSEGRLVVGDAVHLVVDTERHAAIRANHSATHLLQAALKRVLGSHVAQKGSQVEAERMRFDFSHPKPVTAEELVAVENMVNAVILQNSEVTTRIMPTKKAIELGAEAQFGEKYGAEVRVISMGLDKDGETPFSVELCGGTHVERLGDIGVFHIVSESAVASGVRRIEVLTREGARNYFLHHTKVAQAAAAAIKVNVEDLPERVALLSEERRKLERDLTEAKKALALAGPAGGSESAIEEINGTKAILRVVEGVSGKDLKALADEAKKTLESGVAVFVATGAGKASIVVGVTKDLTGKFNAVDLVRIGAQALGGKGGGGRPDMAQAGGPDGSKAQEALKAISAALAA